MQFSSNAVCVPNYAQFGSGTNCCTDKRQFAVSATSHMVWYLSHLHPALSSREEVSACSVVSNEHMDTVCYLEDE